MIEDLDKTVRELIERDLPPDLVEQVSISFATPDDQFPPSSVTLPAIDLFLYDLRVNPELRSNEWELDRSRQTVTRQRAPVRIDCSYLITAWASESAPNPAEDEHRLLGEIIKVLFRYPKLPAQVLQGSLAGQEPMLPTAALVPGPLQSIGEFWQSLGGKPKAALNYSVTIPVQTQEPEDVGPPVTDRLLRLAQTLESK